jgi:hypothetical protein
MPLFRIHLNGLYFIFHSMLHSVLLIMHVLRFYALSVMFIFSATADMLYLNCAL